MNSQKFQEVVEQRKESTTNHEQGQLNNNILVIKPGFLVFTILFGMASGATIAVLIMRLIAWFSGL